MKSKIKFLIYLTLIIAFLTMMTFYPGTLSLYWFSWEIKTSIIVLLLFVIFVFFLSHKLTKFYLYFKKSYPSRYENNLYQFLSSKKFKQTQSLIVSDIDLNLTICEFTLTKALNLKDWKKARLCLQEWSKNNLINASNDIKLQTIIDYQEALDYWQRGQKKTAIDHLLKIYKRVPNDIIVLPELLSWLLEDNQQKLALKIITDCWINSPSHHLGIIIKNSLKDMEPNSRLDFIEKLFSKHESHPDSIKMMAEAYLQARIWGQARELLLKIDDKNLDVSLCFLWAQLEIDGFNDVKSALKWYRKAHDIFITSQLKKNELET
jgi:tetratricopeptide (TPR) repeat protein